MPPTTTSPLAAALATVHARIAEACAACGRDPAGVTLVAVSKTHPIDAVREALAAGQTSFGENRVQEAAQKFPGLRPGHPALRLHLIGALQSNKARDAVRLADSIESLDRTKLAAAIATAITQEQRHPNLLVQVNTGDEPQKAGIPRNEAETFLAQCRDEHGLTISGLMCIPPADTDPTRHFAWLANLAARHGLPILSMGMSNDYPTAIRLGATHIRVGTAIFGHRD